MAAINALYRDNDQAEIKRAPRVNTADDTLSEFERARMMSKTWSMEQD